MSMTQADLLRKAAGPIGTGDFISASGLLAPEQADAFLDAVYEATPLNAIIRHEKRVATSGSIAALGIGSRLLRKKTAGVDDATLVKPVFTDIGYQTVPVRLDWEVEEEVYQRNIEREGFEDHLVRLMTDQVGRDLEDLHLNGDTADTSADAPFLTMHDGWLKKLAGSSLATRINGASTNGGNISKDHFGLAVAALPAKYFTDQMRWIMSPVTKSRYIDYLSNRATPAGDAVLVSGDLTQIRGIPVITAPKMPNSRILLTDPKNLAAVNTQDIRRRKTTEGREAIRRDMRFYAIFLDDDSVIERPDAVADIYGLAA